MSNHLAIATVTAALGSQLLSAAQIGVDGATVRQGPPDAKTGTEGKPVMNIFLYQITPNAQHRNSHMPARRSDGSLVTRSRVALDLRYVLSFYGDSARLEPERMAGAVAAAVEDRPVLSRGAISKAVADANSVLETSDLEDALSSVRITPEAHTLDELSRLWSIFFQVPYALSLGYLCSHVSIEVGEDGPEPLPVATPGIHVAPMSRLQIDEVESGDGSRGSVEWGGILVIKGRGLAAKGLELRIDGHVLTPAHDEKSDTEIRLPLTATRLDGSELSAGNHALQATIPAPGGAPAHLSQFSEARTFALRPTIEIAEVGREPGATASGTMRISFSPSVDEDQAVQLVLDQQATDTPIAVTLSPEEPDDPFPQAELAFSYAELPSAIYLVRAQVEGVASRPEIDESTASPTFGQMTGPMVDLT